MTANEPETKPASPETAIAQRGWRGDEHKLQLDAAKEVGLDGSDVEVDLYTQGFREGSTLEDPDDHAIVFRGRTVLKAPELRHSLRPLLRYLGVSQDAVAVRVHDGTFEIRLSRRAAETSPAGLDSAKLALKLFVGFGLLGLTIMMWSPFFAEAGAAVVWGIGLLLGGWQLRRGIASGRAMLAARFALGLAMLAKEEQLIMPLAGEDGGGGRAALPGAEPAT